MEVQKDFKELLELLNEHKVEYMIVGGMPSLIMEQEDLLDVIEHPDQDEYPGQKIAIIKIDAYAYLVPYVQNEEEIFLKTIIPSRKATNKYVRTKK